MSLKYNILDICTATIVLYPVCSETEIGEVWVGGASPLPTSHLLLPTSLFESPVETSYFPLLT